MQTTKKAGSISTTWDLFCYEVLGNSTEGYAVNDKWRDGETTLRIPVTRYNVGTPHEFRAASPGTKQLKSLWGWAGSVETEGDDIVIYLTDAKTGYPIGEMMCTSHASLSPIRKTTVKEY